MRLNDFKGKSKGKRNIKYLGKSSPLEAKTASASQATGASHKLSNSDNICCLCSGKYDDDISSDGILVKEWIQCTEDKCKLWMHEECAAESNDEFVCACGNTFQ